MTPQWLGVRAGATAVEPDESGDGGSAGGGGKKFGGDDSFGLPEDDGDDEIIALDEVWTWFTHMCPQLALGCPKKGALPSMHSTLPAIPASQRHGQLHWWLQSCAST
jgi:hypothetical protein